MKGPFARLYEWMLRWAAHRHAAWYLGGLSFAESSFFPLPPDIMLAPMSLAQPKKAVRFATIVTLTSVAGGLLGYALGMFAFELLAPWIERAGYWPYYEQARHWFNEWGFWIIFVAGFSPVPYKIFTIGAGAASLALLPFVIASLIGRGTRFFLVALLIAWGGPRLEPWIRTYIERIGWITVLLLLVAVAWWQF